MKTLLNKKVIITGATSGIGRCLTVKLLNAGANVAFCGRSEIKMAQLLTELKHIQNNFYYDTFDISNEDDIIRFVKNAFNSLGQFDILVNCAGVNSARASVSDIKTVDLEWMLRINLVAPFVFVREVYNSMRNKQKGLFINVLSSACNFSNEGIGAYTASKAGFDALVKVFRKEVRDNNIRVCSIYPGGVNTPFRNKPNPEYLNPETVADAIISMMLSDEKSSIDELTIRPMIEKNYC